MDVRRECSTVPVIIVKSDVLQFHISFIIVSTSSSTVSPQYTVCPLNSNTEEDNV